MRHYCKFCQQQLSILSSKYKNDGSNYYCPTCRADFYYNEKGQLYVYLLSTTHKNGHEYWAKFYLDNNPFKFVLLINNSSQHNPVLLLDDLPTNINPGNFPDRLKTMLTFL